MAGKIFINYRRGDDPGFSGRVFDRLQEAFSPDQLFMDVDNIAPGLDFARVLDEQVAKCDVLLAIIGRGWIDAADPTGVRRLDNPEDFVRIEIESALKQNKRVIPVLVGEAEMPRPDELPDTLRPLARRNAVRLTHERFRADVQGFVKALQKALDDAEAQRRAQAEQETLEDQEGSKAAQSRQGTVPTTINPASVFATPAHLETSKAPGSTKWLFASVMALCIVILSGGVWLYQKRAGVTQQESEQAQADMLVPEAIPYISDAERSAIRSTYVPAPDYKAIAIAGRSGFTTFQKDEETAKAAALATCKGNSSEPRWACELYAVGNKVVFARGRLPMPPKPWWIQNPSVEQPFDHNRIPLISDAGREFYSKFPTFPKSKALAISSVGARGFSSGNRNVDEAVRRSLEICAWAGTACIIVAVDDRFVVAIPRTMRATAIFSARSDTAIAADARERVATQLANATRGWSAVAVGDNGRPGVILGVATEQEAVSGALAECNKQTRACRVIAIGPFSVEPLAEVRN
jgi:hypothetical protein